MIEIGMTNQIKRTVQPEWTAASMKSGLLEVLALVLSYYFSR